MSTPGIEPRFIAHNMSARRRTLRTLQVVRHNFAQCLGASHRFGCSWWPTFPRLTSEGVPYRRFSQTWGWDPGFDSHAEAIQEAGRKNRELAIESMRDEITDLLAEMTDEAAELAKL